MNKSHWGDLDSISDPPALKSDALPTELWRIAEGGFQKFIMPLAYKYIYIKNKQKTLGRPGFDLGSSRNEIRRSTN